VGWEGMDWIGLAENRGRWLALVNVGMNFSGSIKSWDFLDKLRNC